GGVSSTTIEAVFAISWFPSRSRPRYSIEYRPSVGIRNAVVYGVQAPAFARYSTPSSPRGGPPPSPDSGPRLDEPGPKIGPAVYDGEPTERVRVGGVSSTTTVELSEAAFPRTSTARYSIP